MSKKKWWSLLLYFWFFPIISAQSLSDCILQTAVTFLGKPYTVNPIPFNESNILKYSEDSFDCVTFVETTTAIALHQMGWNKQEFNTILSTLRYRNGIPDGYASRIHYFTEWLLQAEKLDLGNNISMKMGGEVKMKKIYFMSKHPSAYPPLQQMETLHQIISSEENLSGKPMVFIPKQKIHEILHQLRDGDIIAFTSTIEGLDVNHVGFIKLIKKKPHLIHASQLSRKVEISQKNIWEYIKNRNESDGIIVFRFLDFEKN